MAQKYNVFFIEHDTATWTSWIGYIMGMNQGSGELDFTDYRELVINHKVPKAYDLKTAQKIAQRLKKQYGDYVGIAPAIIPLPTGSPEFLEE